MKTFFRWMLLWVLCLSISTGALAEVSLLPVAQQWDLSMPLEIDLSADVSIHMPFDDDRCAQLNALLGHVSLRINTDPGEFNISRVALRVDDRDALWLAMKENDQQQVQFSCQPGVTYIANEDAPGALLGQPTDISLYGFDGSEQVWMDDAYAMLNAVQSDLETYGKTTSIKTEIKNMGTARTKITYTVPKADATVMGQKLAANCPDGKLRTMLTELVFSGQQKLILWLTSDGEIIRAEYAGNCGADEEHLRKVSIVWRMRRDDTAVRDDLTVKTPGVKGTDYNTINFDRKILKGKNGKVTLESDFTYNTRINNEKTQRSGSIDLTATTKNDSTTLEGTVVITRQMPDEDTAMSIKLMPELSLAADAGIPVVNGGIVIQQLRGKNVIEDAAISVCIAEGSAIDWQEDTVQRMIDSMTEADHVALADSMTAALLPHLVLLPAEDTLFLAADLPEDAWQRIVNAAQAALKEDVQ